MPTELMLLKTDRYSSSGAVDHRPRSYSESRQYMKPVVFGQKRVSNACSVNCFSTASSLSTCKLILTNSLIFEPGLVVYFPRSDSITSTSPPSDCPLDNLLENTGGMAHKAITKRRNFLRRRVQSSCEPIEEVGF